MLFLNSVTFRKINGAGIITIIKMISFRLLILSTNGIKLLSITDILLYAYWKDRNMPAYRSKTSTHGRNMAGARALWRATGVTDQDFGKPIIAALRSTDFSC